MSAALPSAYPCCDPCTEPARVAVPGPQGPAGADGIDGADGISAFTGTTAQFLMPAEGGSVVVGVDESIQFGIGQIVWIESGGAQGYFQVTAKPSSTSITLLNLENTAGSRYITNSPPATPFPPGSLISPAGLQGPSGTAAAGVLLAVNNLIDLANIATSRANLGLGSIALLSSISNANWSGADLAIANGGTGGSTAADARTNLGVAIGADVQAFDAFLLSLASLGTAANRIVYITGVNTAAEAVCTPYALTILNDATALEARFTLDVPVHPAWVSKIANYAATSSDFGILCDTTAGGFTITLPSANTVAGRHFVIKKTSADAFIVTVQSAAGTLDGAATCSISTQWDKLHVASDGSNYYII